MSRAITNQLLEYIDEGYYDKDTLLDQLIYWMSEEEVAEFVRVNELFPDDPEEDE